MILRQTDDLRIERLRPLIPPAILMEQFPITETASTTIAEGREAINRVLRDEDDRLLVVVGPCSIHDVEAARGVRDAPPGRRRSARRRPPPRDARLLREAADDRRLEGAHQRSPARRELRDQRRAGPGARPSPRPRQDGAAGRAASSWTPSRRSSSPTWCRGAPSAPAPPRARSTASSPRASRCRSASRTAPTATCRSPSTRSAPPCTPTSSSR